ncbi:MAG TPA: prephenate dehydrogenase/arogenate dehydrogenase family protein, partial [Longimicrobium sp.]|nr:prephenate dehydrogenase/arogenate dehydrogenase family protein [Longimicrobium sp.]
ARLPPVTDDPAFAGIRTAAVAGLGLIGGSVARDLAARGVRVLGHDRDPSAVAAAIREGVVSAALGDGFEGVEEADVLLLAVPVLAAREVLRIAGPRLDRVRLVTDAGSTKRSIVALAEEMGIGARFVGAHPMAGDHRSGWDASRAGLFAGARVFLCPADGAGEDALALAEALWTGLGGKTETVDAAEHDRLLAWTSHLPQAVSTALAAALAERGIGRGELGPGGRDVTRLAGSSPGMWIDILRDNAPAVSDALAAMEMEIHEMREAVASEDPDRIRERFARGKRWGDDG